MVGPVFLKFFFHFSRHRQQKKRRSPPAHRTRKSTGTRFFFGLKIRKKIGKIKNRVAVDRKKKKKLKRKRKMAAQQNGDNEDEPNWFL